jgi:DNA-binding protein H-NS
MTSLQDLLRQKDDLERQIAAAKSRSRDEAIAKIRTLMQENGLSVSDLTTLKPKKQVSSTGHIRKPVATKYKDGQGNSWTGRGLKPKWLTAALSDGKALEDFKV